MYVCTYYYDVDNVFILLSVMFLVLLIIPYTIIITAGKSELVCSNQNFIMNLRKPTVLCKIEGQGSCIYNPNQKHPSCKKVVAKI